MTNKELYKLRRSLDITQLQLAEMIGVTQASISQVERGVRKGMRGSKTRETVEAKLKEILAAVEKQEAPQEPEPIAA